MRDLLARRYDVEQRARIETTTDSGTVVDSSSITVSFSVRRDAAGDWAGLVESALVAGAGGDTGPLPSLPLPFAFVATRTAPGTMADPAARPGVPDPCTSMARIPLGVVRDVLFPLPDTLFVGRTWADSGRFDVCRDGVRLAMTSFRDFRISGTSMIGDRQVLLVTRATRIALQGIAVRRADTTRVDGSGNSTSQLTVDAITGALLSASGTSELDIAVRGAVRSERARQFALTRAALLSR